MPCTPRSCAARWESITPPVLSRRIGVLREQDVSGQTKGWSESRGRKPLGLAACPPSRKRCGRRHNEEHTSFLAALPRYLSHTGNPASRRGVLTAIDVAQVRGFRTFACLGSFLPCARAISSATLGTRSSVEGRLTHLYGTCPSRLLRPLMSGRETTRPGDPRYSCGHAARRNRVNGRYDEARPAGCVCYEVRWERTSLAMRRARVLRMLATYL